MSDTLYVSAGGRIACTRRTCIGHEARALVDAWPTASTITTPLDTWTVLTDEDVAEWTAEGFVPVCESADSHR